MCISKQVVPTEDISYLTQEGANNDELENSQEEEGSSASLNGESDSYIIERVEPQEPNIEPQEESREEVLEESKDEVFEESKEIKEEDLLYRPILS